MNCYGAKLSKYSKKIISVKTAIAKQIYYIKKVITLLPISLIEAIKHSTLKFFSDAKQLCRKKYNVELHKIPLDLKMIKVLSCVN